MDLAAKVRHSTHHSSVDAPDRIHIKACYFPQPTHDDWPVLMFSALLHTIWSTCDQHIPMCDFPVLKLPDDSF